MCPHVLLHRVKCRHFHSQEKVKVSRESHILTVDVTENESVKHYSSGVIWTETKRAFINFSWLTLSSINMQERKALIQNHSIHFIWLWALWKTKAQVLFLRCDFNRDQAGFYQFQMTNFIIDKHPRAKAVDQKPLSPFVLISHDICRNDLNNSGYCENQLSYRAKWLSLQLFSLLLDSSSNRSIPFRREVARIFDDCSWKLLIQLF